MQNFRSISADQLGQVKHKLKLWIYVLKKRTKPIFNAYSTIKFALILNVLLKLLRELPRMLKLKVCLDVIAKSNLYLAIDFLFLVRLPL